MGADLIQKAVIKMNEVLARLGLDYNMGKLLFHEIGEDLLLAGD